MRNSCTTDSNYRTEKLTFAAYLIASGKAELVGVKPTGIGKGVTFILSCQPSDDDMASFFNGVGTVSALRFAETMTNLKGAAYEAHRRHG